MGIILVYRADKCDQTAPNILDSSRTIIIFRVSVDNKSCKSLTWYPLLDDNVVYWLPKKPSFGVVALT
jgi:hypothetical protein